MRKECIWFNRFLKMLLEEKNKNKSIYDVYVCSWWLRLEYKNENVKTATINYYLNKWVDLGVLKKVVEKTNTRFYLVENAHN